MVTVYPRCIQRVGSLYNDATFRLRASYTKVTAEIPFEPVIHYSCHIVVMHKHKKSCAGRIAIAYCTHNI